MKKLIILIFLIIAGLSYTTTAEASWWRTWWGDSSGVSQIVCFEEWLYVLSTFDYLLESKNKGNIFTLFGKGYKTNSLFVNKYERFFATSDSGVVRCCWDNLGLIGSNIKAIYIDSHKKIYAVAEDSVDQGGGIYSTTDNGENWNYFIEGIETEHTNGLFIPYNLTEINDTLYLMSANGFYYSIDNGQSWNMVISDKLDFKYNSPKIIIANDDGDIYLLTGDIYIKKKNDDFNNIHQVFVTNDSISFIDITVLEYYVFACTGEEGQGVFYSTDKGLTFTESKEGLNNNEIICVGADRDDYVYAGTTKDGLYVNSKLVTDVNISPATNNSFTDYNLYPIPSKNIFNITFSTCDYYNLKLKIFDKLGRQVYAIDDKLVYPGLNNLSIDLNNNPNGCYYLVFQLDNQILYDKIVLIK
ncbi:T9SS type A sorting domain-containing protein [Bacteroidota bacterium]